MNKGLLHEKKLNMIIIITIIKIIKINKKMKKIFYARNKKNI